MGRILFIINPVAGGGKTKNIIPLIEEEMDKYKRDYDMILTKEPKEAIDLAAKNSELYDIIVAVGGDGTINEVSKGLLKAGKGTLGIIPGGTGNDMIKSLGIPSNSIEALEVLNKGFKKEIDIGKIDDCSFLNISSVGFDGEVMLNHDKFRKVIKGKASYIIAIIYTLLSYKKKKIRIDVDGKVLHQIIILLAVGNGKYYGGGLKILPMAKIDDGYFHICVISGLSTLKTLFLFPSIFKGNHLKYKKYVKVYKGKSIEIKSEEYLYINIDGEISPKRKDIKFIMSNLKLNVICKEG